MSFGYVIDYRCAPKDALGGIVAAATRLAEGVRLQPERTGACGACAIADVEGPGCIGVVSTPLPAAAERWLVEQLPDALETISGEVIKQALSSGFSGQRARPLRAAGKLEARSAFERSWGSFFRRFTVSSDQILEQMFCVGEVEPPQALAVLVELGALAVDGRVPRELDEGAGLAEVATADAAARRARTQCMVTPTSSDQPALLELKRYLRALHAAFCVDARVLLFQD
ncbi:MAG TPA: hypothetical protein VKN99_17340 [Polyangia bacterium]|nr:hypothetical protein [Polyangia bacterium]